MLKIMTPQLSNSNVSGFTLLELLVVVAILAAMANMTLSTFSKDVNQQRFDQTRYKMKNIKRAIIGDSSVTYNNELSVSGFIADMGRVPYALKDLLYTPHYCEDNGDLKGVENDGNEYSINTKDNCEANGFNWKSYIYTKTLNDNNELSSSNLDLKVGWRGPYINVISDYDGVMRYRDAWGNEGLNDASIYCDGDPGDNRDKCDSDNYGWNYITKYSVGSCNTVSETNICLSSNGLNGVDADDNDFYKSRYPQQNSNTDADVLIHKADYMLDAPEGNKLRVNISSNQPTNNSYMFIYYAKDGFINGCISAEHTKNGSEYTYDFDNGITCSGASEALIHGHYLYAICQAINPASSAGCTDIKNMDNLLSAKPPRRFILGPKHSIPNNLIW